MQHNAESFVTWSSGKMEYAPLGEGMLVCDALAGAVPGYHAGYVNLQGGTLTWTLQANEVMWVVTGEVTFTHENRPHQMSQGDMVLLGEGAAMQMAGSPEARVAWFSLPPAAEVGDESGTAEGH